MEGLIREKQEIQEGLQFLSIKVVLIKMEHKGNTTRCLLTILNKNNNQWVYKASNNRREKLSN